MPNYPLHNISLSNIYIQYRGGGQPYPSDKTYREQGTNYPEPRWAGPTPAWGLYARHVDGLNLSHIRMETIIPDARKAILMEDVQHERLDDVDTGKTNNF
jgi:hypothetical protein